MSHLRSYAVGESAEISLKSALAEARDTLREVRKRREFGDSDIAVRTELSYARQGLNSVELQQTFQRSFWLHAVIFFNCDIIRHTDKRLY